MSPAAGGLAAEVTAALDRRGAEGEAARSHLFARRLVHETGSAAEARRELMTHATESSCCVEQAEAREAFVAWFEARVDRWIDTPLPIEN